MTSAIIIQDKRLIILEVRRLLTYSSCLSQSWSSNLANRPVVSSTYVYTKLKLHTAQKPKIKDARWVRKHRLSTMRRWRNSDSSDLYYYISREVRWLRIVSDPVRAYKTDESHGGGFARRYAYYYSQNRQKYSNLDVASTSLFLDTRLKYLAPITKLSTYY